MQHESCPTLLIQMQLFKAMMPRVVNGTVHAPFKQVPVRALMKTTALIHSPSHRYHWRWLGPLMVNSFMTVLQNKMWCFWYMPHLDTLLSQVVDTVHCPGLLIHISSLEHNAHTSHASHLFGFRKATSESLICFQH